MRILVVEDEKEIADGIQAILKQEGYESDAVYDGNDGVEYIRTLIYDGKVNFSIDNKSLKYANGECVIARL